MKLNWGIAGVSHISHDFCGALDSSPQNNILAVSSHNKESADEFGSRYRIQNSYGSHADMAEDKNITVVFVDVAKFETFRVSKLMLDNKKHVICISPFSLNYVQTKELVDLAVKSGLFFMKSFPSRFFPVYRYLSRLVESNKLGDIREVHIKHSCVDADAAAMTGMLFSIGSYALQLALFIFPETPSSVKAEGKINTNHVDLFFKAEIRFKGGRKAYIICSALSQLENQATIITTKGPICIPQYWAPRNYLALGEMAYWNLKYEVDANINPFEVLVHEAAKCIAAGRTQCPIASHADCLRIAKIQDEIRQQIGVRHTDCNADSKSQQKYR